ncbi:MAG TPA: sigma-70 family RNA polymerase sigma factor [Thermoanaerobaculia bacterium]|nr:sigma-70 family RNA polymerase sigma factor [Thermoanaerobaculia bacterium]
MNDPESTYLEHLASIERIAAFVARKNHLNPDDTVEFVQVVRCRLFEDDYAIIRKFEGRSSFTTYLTTVINRLFYEWRVKEWGKWRPSAEARRIGDVAIMLERLVTRDGFTFSEAARVLTMRAGAGVSIAELEAIYLRLPPRNPRPVVVSGEVSPDAAIVESDADERVGKRDRERTLRQAVQTIDSVLESFGEDDRLILKLRFWKSYKVPEIARVMQLDQKKLYKRLEKLFATFRRALESAGVSRADIDALLVRGDHDIHLDVLS